MAETKDTKVQEQGKKAEAELQEEQVVYDGVIRTKKQGVGLIVYLIAFVAIIAVFAFAGTTIYQSVSNTEEDTTEEVAETKSVSDLKNDYEEAKNELKSIDEADEEAKEAVEEKLKEIKTKLKEQEVVEQSQLISDMYLASSDLDNIDSEKLDAVKEKLQKILGDNVDLENLDENTLKEKIQEAVKENQDE
jgi:hypothetical protein